MATLTVRGLSEETKRRLRVQAAEHDRSMEAEIRAILEESVNSRSFADVFAEVRAFLAAEGEPLGDEFDDVRSHDMPRAVDFGESE